MTRPTPPIPKSPSGKPQYVPDVLAPLRSLIYGLRRVWSRISQKHDIDGPIDG